MTARIGWWDYDETGQPTLINRSSGEHVRLSGETKLPGKQSEQRWVRLDYICADMEFPVLACWEPELGHIVVDYVSSALLWRQESNSDLPYPPYGAWSRVDDCIIDAIWCWPNVADYLKTDSKELNEYRAGPGWVGRIGGWCNGEWRSELIRVDICPTHDLSRDLDRATQYSLGDLPSLDRHAPVPWFYVGVAFNEECGDEYSSWNGKLLHESEDEESERFLYGTPGTYTSGGKRTVEIGGAVPQMRSHDGSRILYPSEATIYHEDRNTLTANGVAFEYCRREFGCATVLYERFGPVVSSEDRTDGPFVIWPKFKIISPGIELFHPTKVVSPPNTGQGVVDTLDEVVTGIRERQRFMLSIPAQRDMVRDIADAFLFWQGTSEAPELWGPMHGPYLTYEKPEFIVAMNSITGGRVSPVRTFAALSVPDELKKRSFDLESFCEASQNLN